MRVGDAWQHQPELGLAALVAEGRVERVGRLHDGTRGEAAVGGGDRVVAVDALADAVADGAGLLLPVEGGDRRLGGGGPCEMQVHEHLTQYTL